MSKQKELNAIYRNHASGDAWGDTMAFGFPLCEILYLRDEHDVPELMRFRPGASGVSLNEDCSITQDLNQFETEDLETFGRKLNRLMNLLKAARRDY